MNHSRYTPTVNTSNSAMHGMKRGNEAEDILPQKRHHSTPWEYAHHGFASGENVLTGSHTTQLKEQERQMQDIRVFTPQQQHVPAVASDRRILQPSSKMSASTEAMLAAMHNAGVPCGHFVTPALDPMVGSVDHCYPPNIHPCLQNSAAQNGPMQGFVGHEPQPTLAGFPSLAKPGEPQLPPQLHEQSQQAPVTQVTVPPNVGAVCVVKDGKPVELRLPDWVRSWLMQVREQIRPENVVRKVPGVHPAQTAPPDGLYTPRHVFALRHLPLLQRLHAYTNLMSCSKEAITSLGQKAFRDALSNVIAFTKELRERERVFYETVRQQGTLARVIQDQARSYSLKEVKELWEQHKAARNVASQSSTAESDTGAPLVASKNSTGPNAAYDRVQDRAFPQPTPSPSGIAPQQNYKSRTYSTQATRSFDTPNQRPQQAEVVDLTSEDEEVISGCPPAWSQPASYGCGSEAAQSHQPAVPEGVEFTSSQGSVTSGDVSPDLGSPDSVFSHTETNENSPNSSTQWSSPSGASHPECTGARFLLDANGVAQELKLGTKRRASDDTEDAIDSDLVKKRFRQDCDHQSPKDSDNQSTVQKPPVVDLTDRNPIEKKRSPPKPRLDEAKFNDLTEFKKNEKIHGKQKMKAGSTETAVHAAIGGGLASKLDWIRQQTDEQNKQKQTFIPEQSVPPEKESESPNKSKKKAEAGSDTNPTTPPSPKARNKKPGLPEAPDYDMSKYPKLANGKFACGRTHRGGEPCKKCKDGLTAKGKQTEIFDLWAQEWSDWNNLLQENGKADVYPNDQFVWWCASKKAKKEKPNEDKTPKAWQKRMADEAADRKKREEVQKAEDAKRKAEEDRQKAEEKHKAEQNAAQDAKYEEYLAEKKRFWENARAQKQEAIKKRAKQQEEAKLREEAEAERKRQAKQEEEDKRKAETELEAQRQRAEEEAPSTASRTSTSHSETSDEAEDDDWERDLFGESLAQPDEELQSERRPNPSERNADAQEVTEGAADEEEDADLMEELFGSNPK